MIYHQDLLSLGSCRMHSAKLVVGRSVTAPPPADCRPFCPWDRWHNYFHLGPLPVDWVKGLLNIVQMWINLFNYSKNTFKQWTQNECRQEANVVCETRVSGQSDLGDSCSAGKLDMYLHTSFPFREIKLNATAIYKHLQVWEKNVYALRNWQMSRRHK